MIKGHKGIYEVAINSETVYTNRSECSVLPTEEEIFSMIELLTPVVDPTSSTEPEKK